MGTFTEAQYKLANDQKREKSIKADIRKIDDAIASNEKQSLQAIHMYIDGKYSAYVPDWDKSVYCYVLEYGFNYEVLDEASLIHNLQMMKAKLEGYAIGFEKTGKNTYSPSNNVNVSVSNTNEVNVSVSFEEVRRQVEDMTSLTDEQTKEILEKISEIESVYKEGSGKKSKWEKVKPILVWLADKSCDVGLALLPLLLNFQN